MRPAFMFQAALYARASKDDADSSTIENQFELMQEHIKSMPEIQVAAEKRDNGYSGIDFFRPDFIEMMNDIQSGRINCVIVKDLSRLGRNHIEVGELMDEIFPKYNVRLISVNDRYDSLYPRTDAEDIILPFKNLINEQYLRDFSVKIRSHLAVKRRNGDFVAAFAPYGYVRDEHNKHRMVADEHAAVVVQDIFRRKLEGMSMQGIADWLNAVCEPSPSEYKKKQGSNFFSPFQKNERAAWSAVAVGRILRNPVYTGTLVQGKVTTPSYKVKRRVIKSEAEWNVVQDTHEPIVAKSDYEIIAGILAQDTRIPPRKGIVFPLSGVVRCGDCKNNMVRKKSDKFCYYVCATSKAGRGCSSRLIRSEDLESAVLAAVNRQVSFFLEIEKCVDNMRVLPLGRSRIKNIDTMLAYRKKEIGDCEGYKQSLYEDYKCGVLSSEDYAELDSGYTRRIAELWQAAKILRKEVELLINNNDDKNACIEHFIRYRNIPELSRQLVAHLIERVYVYEGKRVEIVLRFTYAH